MKSINFLFDPFGRVARLPYIAFVVASWLISGLAFWYLGDTVAIPLGIFFVFPAFCLGIRRWHDFNFRGWWVLIRFSPLVALYGLNALSAWLQQPLDKPMMVTVLLIQWMPPLTLLVECLVPGSKSPNRFGTVPGTLWTWKRRPAPGSLAKPVSVAAVAKVAPARKAARKATASRPARKPAKAAKPKAKKKKK